MKSATRIILVVWLSSILQAVCSFTLRQQSWWHPRQRHQAPWPSRWIWLALSTSKQEHTWSPQDLTKDIPGFLPIPDDDYIKQYQANPKQLWPVEFFIIPYRHIKKGNNQRETQILVRPSANGTSKWGLGTGVPVTRWILSKSSEQQPPLGYEWKTPKVMFEASNYPEFSKDDNAESWTYRKIDICQDAFDNTDDLRDLDLQEYAKRIRNALKSHLETQADTTASNSWESIRRSVIQGVVDDERSVTAIQGTLRMSGLFVPRDGDSSRYIPLGSAPDPATIVNSMMVFTMFPQMPDPMPLPSCTPEELNEELFTRDARMAKSGRDPHKDKYGRVSTHKSTSNVSNTIHGIYLPIDVSNLLDDNEIPPALDLFGVKRIPKEWKSLHDLNVLSKNGQDIGTADPKPTFISGFIVRQLVKEGVIAI